MDENSYLLLCKISAFLCRIVMSATWLSLVSIMYGCCSWTTMPRLTGHLQPRRNWPTWVSSILINHPILRIWPVGLPPVPWTEKELKGGRFSSDAEVITAAETWLKGQLSDFFF